MVQIVNDVDINNSGLKGHGKVVRAKSREGRANFVKMSKKHLNAHPVEILAILTKQAMVDEDYYLALAACKELAQYTAPKLKSVDHSLGAKESMKPVQIVLNGGTNQVNLSEVQTLEDDLNDFGASEEPIAPKEVITLNAD